MPDSASALVSTKIKAESVTTRSTWPTARANMATTSTRAGATRRTSHGVSAPRPANAMVGRVVTRPAVTPERPSPSRTSSSSAPRLVTTARRLSATSSIPTSTSAPPVAGCVRRPVPGSRVGRGSTATGAGSAGAAVGGGVMTSNLQSWDEFGTGDVTSATVG